MELIVNNHGRSLDTKRNELKQVFKSNNKIKKNIDVDIENYNKFVDMLVKVPYAKVDANILFKNNLEVNDGIDVKSDIHVSFNIELKRGVLDINPIKGTIDLDCTLKDVKITDSNISFDFGKIGTIKFGEEGMTAKLKATFLSKFRFGKKEKVDVSDSTDIKLIGKIVKFKLFNEIDIKAKKGYSEKALNEAIKFLNDNKESIKNGFKKNLNKSIKESNKKADKQFKDYDYREVFFEMNL